MSISRRNLLALGGLGALGAGAMAIPLSSVSAQTVSALPAANMPQPYQAAFKTPPVLQPFKTEIDPADGSPVNHYKLTQRAAMAEIVPGLATPILGYNGIFPGPTISLDQGTKAVVTMRNQLPEKHPVFGTPTATSTHLHGSASLPQYDGYASDITMPGFVKDYHYPNFQPARTLWYHDHGVHYTAQNAYSGLAGVYVMHDPLERDLLPQGEFDVPLAVNDMHFQANGAAAYDDHTHSGLWGDVILVNGVPWPVMKVKRRVYRFRFLNCSISRSFRPTLSTGEPLVMVATDGGLMPKSQEVAEYRHAGAERYEFLIDFSKYQPGTRVELLNLSNPNNIDYDNTGKIMAFDVTDEPFQDAGTTNVIPDLLAESSVMSLRAEQSIRRRHMSVERQNGQWMISGRTWADVIASNFEWTFADVGLDDVEIWDLENTAGGWFHPLHIHLVDFQILSRNGQAPFPWELGPKDVAYLGEGETVSVLVRFEHQRGRYMVHCHNLPHEDHDMMVQFRVGLEEGEPDPNHPIEAARPVLDTEIG
jgi:FtsP/CotA-like multicopper oxidase with cupredoxin domain